MESAKRLSVSRIARRVCAKLPQPRRRSRHRPRSRQPVAVTLGVGFDPYLGVYHRSRYGRPSLALDLAEEFRPLIADSVVLGLLNNGEITPADLIRRAGAVSLTADGRRTVLRAYERRLDTEIRHPVFGYQISYRRVLDVQARLLAAVMVGEIPEYIPMVTR
ncbi:MAG: CRISPR-associated endonuclease Cas1 [Pseudonocardiaceae bacterium]